MIKKESMETIVRFQSRLVIMDLWNQLVKISNKIFMKDPFADYTLLISIKAMIEAKKKIAKETIINSL